VNSRTNFDTLVLQDDFMINSWWEIQVICDPKLEDSVFWRLQRFGCKGTVSQLKEQNYLIKGYIPQLNAKLLDIAALSLWLRQDALLLELSEPETSWQLIEEEDWSKSWKRHWKPQEIGDRFLVCPAWLEPPNQSDKLVIRLDPGSAFGTGSHPTTQLCLSSLEMRITSETPDQVIADIGCGSGILGIGAVLLGSKQVYGVDIDSLCVQAAAHNRELNQIAASDFIIAQGSAGKILELVPEGVDGVICNIQADVIIKLMPLLSQMTKPTGWAILSGIVLDQTMALAEVLEAHGWTVAALWKQGEWCCFNLRRSEE
jgi:ribosomal protein L11 methyltransferase